MNILQRMFGSAKPTETHTDVQNEAESMNEHPVLANIRETVEGNDVLLFMKGSPQFPQCGFSAAVIQMLNFMGVEYHTVDVLSDAEVREGIKVYSNWPTIPQLYVKGEFVGGCDILREMFEKGELTEYMNTQGIANQPATQ